MIPILGAIVGLYCFVRLLAMATQAERFPAFIRGLAAFSAIAIVVLTAMLLAIRIPSVPAP